MMIATFNSFNNNIPGLRSFTLAISITIFFATAGFVSCSGQTDSSAVKKDSLATLLLPAPKELSSAEKNKLNNECQQWFDTILKNTGFNGGVLVAKGGDIIFEKYRGLVSLAKNDTITPETPFHIASVSKTLTGMATLKLWQDGKISLDDEYSKYFPTFNYPGVTIRTLLNHRSGLPNYLSFMEKMWPSKKVHVTNQDVFNYLVNKKSGMENIARPDTRFSYCNTNFVLLALLIEKVTATPLPVYLHNTIFAPLQMNNTFVYTPDKSDSIPPNYDFRGREIPLMFLDDTYGDKNVYSTVRDLLKWDRALSSGLIFTPATLAEAYKGYSHEKEGVKNYGLGWRMDNFPNGKKMIFHNGWWHGNNAAFLRLPDEDATIIVVNSRYTNATYKAKLLINDFAHYYDKATDEETDNIPASKPVPPAREKKVAKKVTVPAKTTTKKTAGKHKR